MLPQIESKMDDNRVVLVTGASGFGKLTSSTLAKRGFRTFGTSRKPTAVNEDGVEMLQLDITSDPSVTKCLSGLMEKAGRVDVLVNNAGQVLTGSLEETSVDEAKAHFDSNFFGAVRMVNRQRSLVGGNVPRSVRSLLRLGESGAHDIFRSTSAGSKTP